MDRPKPAQRPSDEVLLAFADGALTGEEADAVARHLETDEDARQLVDTFKRTAVLVSAAYDPVLDAPVPERLVKAASGEPAAAAPSNVVPLRRRMNGWPKASVYLAPLAASVLLAVGAVAGYRLAAVTPPDSKGLQLAVGPLPAGAPIATILETTASNMPVTPGRAAPTSAAELMVVATFYDRNGRACREFEVTFPPNGAAADPALFAAIGCRNSEGRWSIEGAVHLAGGPSPSLGEFNPASGKSFSAIEGVLTALGAKPAITPAEEQALIESRWGAK